MYKIFIIASVLAYANAGILGTPAVATYSAAPDVSSAYIHHAPIALAPAPISYAAPAVSYSAPVAIHSPAYGSTHQSVERSLGGAQSISHYSKAIDSAFSSVRKFDTRITNDALTVAHGPVVAKTVAAPTFAYSTAPVYAKAVAPVATYAAGPVATYAAAAPVATYAAAAPIVAKAPVVAKAAIAYSPATVVAHTTFSGFGTAYEWIFVIASVLAYANAGILGTPAVATYSAASDVSSAYIHHAPIAVAPAPISYAAPAVSYSAPVAIHSPAYGSTHQSVERSLGGAQSISHYSKAIDSAFSSVRKFDTRITNDALTVAHAPVVAKTVPAPTFAYSTAPVYAKAVAPVATYAAGPVATYAAAPVATYAAAAPIVAKAPVVAKAALAYSPATVVAHTTFSGFGTAYEW